MAPPCVLGSVEGSTPSGEGGLLGLAVPPGPDPAFVLAYTTTATDNRLVRIEWDGERLGRQSPILTGIPKNSYHDGGRLLAAPDGTFVVGTGDAGVPDLAQDPAQPGRQGPAHHGRRLPRPGQPRSRLTRLHARATATCRASPSTARGGCGRASSGRTTPTSSTCSSPGATTGGPCTRAPRRTAGTRTRPCSGRRRPSASPSGIAIVDDVAYVASLRGEVLWQVPLVGERPRRAGAARPRRPRPAPHRRGRPRRIAVARSRATPTGAAPRATGTTASCDSPSADDGRVGGCPPPRSCSGSSPSCWPPSGSSSRSSA